MEIIAISKSVRVAPRKVRLIADAVRKLPIEDAKAQLTLLNKRGAVVLNKTLKSAIANAINNNKMAERDLKIKAIEVTEAQSYKRFKPSTRGRVHPYKRRGSNIKIVLESPEVKKEIKKEEVKKEETNGTKS